MIILIGYLWKTSGYSIHNIYYPDSLWIVGYGFPPFSPFEFVFHVPGELFNSYILPWLTMLTVSVFSAALAKLLGKTNID